jgi:hypothetical protein
VNAFTDAARLHRHNAGVNLPDSAPPTWRGHFLEARRAIVPRSNRPGQVANSKTTPNVNAFTDNARLRRHNEVFDQFTSEPTYPGKKVIDHAEEWQSHRLCLVIMARFVAMAVLVGSITAIRIIFFDWDAEKAKEVTVGLDHIPSIHRSAQWLNPNDKLIEEPIIMEYYAVGVVAFIWIVGLVAAVSVVSVRRSGIGLTAWLPRIPRVSSRRSVESSRNGAP